MPTNLDLALARDAIEAALVRIESPDGAPVTGTLLAIASRLRAARDDLLAAIVAMRDVP